MLNGRHICYRVQIISGLAEWLKPVILVPWDVQIQRFMVWDQAGQRACETPFQPMAGHGEASLSSQLQGSTNKRILVQASPGLKWDPVSNITNTTRAEDMPQLVDRLPSKHEVLSSNISTATHKKNHVWAALNKQAEMSTAVRTTWEVLSISQWVHQGCSGFTWKGRKDQDWVNCKSNCNESHCGPL
jgi:hypothetical protein